MLCVVCFGGGGGGGIGGGGGDGAFEDTRTELTDTAAALVRTANTSMRAEVLMGENATTVSATEFDVMLNARNVCVMFPRTIRSAPAVGTTAFTPIEYAAPGTRPVT